MDNWGMSSVGQVQTPWGGDPYEQSQQPMLGSSPPTGGTTESGWGSAPASGMSGWQSPTQSPQVSIQPYPGSGEVLGGGLGFQQPPTMPISLPVQQPIAQQPIAALPVQQPPAMQPVMQSPTMRPAWRPQAGYGNPWRGGFNRGNSFLGNNQWDNRFRRGGW